MEKEKLIISIENLEKMIRENPNDKDLKILREVYKEVIEKKNKGYLAKFSKEELERISDTLYATKGFIFSDRDKETKEYFENKDWYKGKFNDIKEYMSLDEIFLERSLKNYQEKLGKMSHPLPLVIYYLKS